MSWSRLLLLSRHLGCFSWENLLLCPPKQMSNGMRLISSKNKEPWKNMHVERRQWLTPFVRQSLERWNAFKTCMSNLPPLLWVWIWGFSGLYNRSPKAVGKMLHRLINVLQITRHYWLPSGRIQPQPWNKNIEMLSKLCCPNPVKHLVSSTNWNFDFSFCLLLCIYWKFEAID